MKKDTKVDVDALKSAWSRLVGSSDVEMDASEKYLTSERYTVMNQMKIAYRFDGSNPIPVILFNISGKKWINLRGLIRTLNREARKPKT